MRKVVFALNVLIAVSVGLSFFSCGSDDSSSSPTPEPIKPKVDTPQVSYGSFFDSRDNKYYPTVTFNSKEWMAKNLDWDGAGVCYDNKPENCTIYGRLYTWAEVMNGEASSRTNPSKVKGICPNNWHIPSDSEWTELTDIVSDSSIASDVAMTILKSDQYWRSRPGTNIYRFSVLPAGMVNPPNNIWPSAKFSDIGWNARFWTSSTAGQNGTISWMRDFYATSGNFRTVFSVTDGISLRCVRD